MPEMRDIGLCSMHYARGNTTYRPTECMLSKLMKCKDSISSIGLSENIRITLIEAGIFVARFDQLN